MEIINQKHNLTNEKQENKQKNRILTINNSALNIKT